MSKSSEPVLIGSAVLWVLTQAGAVVVGHTDLISGDQWSALSSALVPVITTVVIAVIGWITRGKVTPVAKLVADVVHVSAPVAVTTVATPVPVVTAPVADDGDVFVATGDASTLPVSG